jgi:hypothetical protein
LILPSGLANAPYPNQNRKSTATTSVGSEDRAAAARDLPVGSGSVKKRSEVRGTTGP